MAVEPVRGCGHREVGGLYLCGEGITMVCCRLPSEILPCEHCGQVLKQSRQWTWQSPEYLLAGSKARCMNEDWENMKPSFVIFPAMCPIAEPAKLGRVGLLWVGERHYTPDTFKIEAAEMGVSKRIGGIPKDYDFGNPPLVFLGHPNAVVKGFEHRYRLTDDGRKWSQWISCEHPQGPEAPHLLPGPIQPKEWEHRPQTFPGIFFVFRPTKVELIVTESMLKTKEVQALVKKGVVPVIVPEADSDHARKVRKRKWEDLHPIEESQAPTMEDEFSTENPPDLGEGD